MTKPVVMFCQPTPADGYEYDPTSDPDSTACYLALAAEDTRAAIGHLQLACDDSRVDLSLRVALDALRDALTAIEAEMEAGDAQP